MAVALKPIQLTIWPDDRGRVDIPCEVCGHDTDSLPYLLQRDRVAEQRVLNDPRLQFVRNDQRRLAFFKAVLPSFLYTRDPVGIQALADAAGYAPATVSHHITRLVDAGIVDAIPKRENGKYHHYRLAFPNGSTNS